MERRRAEGEWKKKGPSFTQGYGAFKENRKSLPLANDDLSGRLNGIWMGSYKLRANMARYGRNENVRPPGMQQKRLKSVIVKHQDNRSIRSVIISKEERIRDERSYAEIVKGDGKLNVRVEEPELEDPKVIGRKVNVHEEEEDWHEITVIPRKEDEELVKKVLIGEVKSYEMLQNISDMPRLEGIYNVKVSYVGGFHVLIEFDNEDLADDFLRKARPSWSNWFSNLAKWHRDFEIGKRLASISIYGVPLHVWNSEVFEEIARVWWEPVCLTNEDNSNLNKEVRRVGILTSEAPWINDFVKVNVQGRCYKVRVIEDPSRSMGMTPSDGNLDSDQSTNEDWFDLDDNQSEGVLLEKVDMNNDNCGGSDDKGGRVSASQHDRSVESSKDREKSKEQSSREVEKAVEKSKLRGNEGVNGNLLEVHKEPKDKNIEPNTFNPEEKTQQEKRTEEFENR
ncbi:hypothetical protein L1887_39196 [Cichorium endivia]|nr:hypothetical protein L1887_39196 [Cichorium endivia]